jgi:hypothetical protein
MSSVQQYIAAGFERKGDHQGVVEGKLMVAGETDGGDVRARALTERRAPR